MTRPFRPERGLELGGPGEAEGTLNGGRKYRAAADCFTIQYGNGFLMAAVQNYTREMVY